MRSVRLRLRTLTTGEVFTFSLLCGQRLCAAICTRLPSIDRFLAALRVYRELCGDNT